MTSLLLKEYIINYIYHKTTQYIYYKTIQSFVAYAICIYKIQKMVSLVVIAVLFIALNVLC